MDSIKTREPTAAQLEPLNDGWIREVNFRNSSPPGINRFDIYYFTPPVNGKGKGRRKKLRKKLRSKRELDVYLANNPRVTFTQDNFSFFHGQFGIGPPKERIISKENKGERKSSGKPAEQKNSSIAAAKAAMPGSKSTEEASHPPDVSKWTEEDVAAFITLKSNEEAAELFLHHQIDGKALLLMEREDLTLMRVKIGPTLKIQKAILELKAACKDPAA